MVFNYGFLLHMNIKLLFFFLSWTGGSYLKTHDFLQPLERLGKTTCAKEETSVEISTVEKPPPAAPPPSVAHLLPGGIGTYSISHISYFNQRVPKPEGNMFTVAQTSSTDRNDENSNCSSYSGSGFTLWEESAVKKGETGKENMGDRRSVRGNICAYFTFRKHICITTKTHSACTLMQDI